MACEMMTGFNFRLVMSQYSLASTFTFRWSMPSWHMSACRETHHTYLDSPEHTLASQQTSLSSAISKAWFTCSLVQASR